MCYFSEMTYLRWCRPFHYKHFFHIFTTCPVKMCFCQDIQQHVPPLQERNSFSHFIQFWPIILSLKWLSRANNRVGISLNHVSLPSTFDRLGASLHVLQVHEIYMNWAEYVSCRDLINDRNNSNHYDCCRPQEALLFWAPQKASKIEFAPEGL